MKHDYYVKADPQYPKNTLKTMTLIFIMNFAYHKQLCIKDLIYFIYYCIKTII